MSNKKTIMGQKYNFLWILSHISAIISIIAFPPLGRMVNSADWVPLCRDYAFIIQKWLPVVELDTLEKRL